MLLDLRTQGGKRVLTSWCIAWGIRPCFKCGHVKHFDEFYFDLYGCSKPRYRSRCKACCISEDSSWQKRNPTRAAAKVKKYQTLKTNAEGHCSETQWNWRLQMLGDACFYCRGPWTEVEHVIPLARGGSNWPINLRPICASCNATKGARRPGEFDQWLVTKNKMVSEFLNARLFGKDTKGLP